MAFDPSQPFELDATAPDATVAPDADVTLDTSDAAAAQPNDSGGGTLPSGASTNDPAVWKRWLADAAGAIGSDGISAAQLTDPASASTPALPDPAPALSAPVPPPSTFDPSQPFDVEHHPSAGPTGDSVWNTTDLGRRAGEAIAGPMAGFLSLPRSAAQGVDYLGRQVGVDVGASDALGSIQTPDTGQQLFPDYATARDMAYNTTGGTEYKPTTLGGRAVQAGVGAALQGGVRAIPGMVAGGGMAEAAKEFFPNHPNISAFLAFLGGQKVGNAIATAPQRAIGAAIGADTNANFQAYKNQGVNTSLSGDVSGNPSLQFWQARAQKTPAAAEDIRMKSQQAESDWQNAVIKNADTLGPSTTMQEAGKSLQDSANSWLTTFKAAQDHLWNKFRSTVPSDAPISVANYQTALDGVTQDFGGANATAGVLQPQLAGQLKDALGVDLGAGTKLPWQAVQSARTRLGQMMETGQGIGDMQQSQLKRLYGGLSQDMAAGATDAGSAASAAFNRASAYTSGGHAILDDHIQPILNATNPESAATWALSQSRQGGSRLQAIETQMPGAGTNLGSVVLRNAAGKGSGSFPSAVGNSRLSPEAQNVLFGPAQQGVQDLTTVANARKQTQDWVNRSNSDVQAEGGLLGRAVMAKEMGDLGHVVAGTPGRIAGIGLGLAQNGIAGSAYKHIIASPAVSRMYSTNPLIQFGPRSTRAAIGNGIPSALSPSLRLLGGQ